MWKWCNYKIFHFKIFLYCPSSKKLRVVYMIPLLLLTSHQPYEVRLKDIYTHYYIPEKDKLSYCCKDNELREASTAKVAFFLFATCISSDREDTQKKASKNDLSTSPGS